MSTGGIRLCRILTRVFDKTLSLILLLLNYYQKRERVLAGLY